MNLNMDDEQEVDGVIGVQFLVYSLMRRSAKIYDKNFMFSQV